MNASTATIPRHAIQPFMITPEKLAFEDELIAIKQDQVDDGPDGVSDLPALFNAPRDAAGIAHARQPDHPALPGYLRLTGRATLAACQLAETKPGSTVTLDLGLGRTHAVQAPNGSLLRVDEYTTGHLAAMAARDADTLNALARVDLRRLDPQDMAARTWQMPWARALQGFQLGADWAGESFVAALRGADPKEYPQASSTAAWIAFLVNPVMALYAATMQDAAAFNAALHEAVEAHRTYYGELRFDPPEMQENDPHGFIALGPLAFAVAMADRGWPITVRSDYLPHSLIERR